MSVKIWNGSSWIGATLPVKIWNGSAWVNVTPNPTVLTKEFVVNIKNEYFPVSMALAQTDLGGSALSTYTTTLYDIFEPTLYAQYRSLDPLRGSADRQFTLQMRNGSSNLGSALILAERVSGTATYNYTTVQFGSWYAYYDDSSQTRYLMRYVIPSSHYQYISQTTNFRVTTSRPDNRDGRFYSSTEAAFFTMAVVRKPS